MRNIYLELTEQFNRGRLRAIICSGQAVVLHRLAIMSKDGDWIAREEEEALQHILQVLESRGARYRFGAPLDVRWMSGGWSSHFEFTDQFRVRADFFSRPPRISEATLARIWREQEDRNPPFLDPPELAEMKKTNREKDYVVIGELGRIMTNPADQLLYSRSARDLITLAKKHPDLTQALSIQRPLLELLTRDEDTIAAALDQERRELIKKNEDRLKRRMNASKAWLAAWTEISRRVENLPLREAHSKIIEAASNLLPYGLEESHE